ncbi:TPA: acyltransferase family protein, partial [Raoultella ornithinolytica]
MRLYNSSRISSIDSLRFAAALLVCIAHLIERFHINTYFSVFILGKIGVVIFFCISGYLIPYSLKKENGGLKVFWNSRFFRLYPMYWVSIIFAVLCFDKYNAVQILANITMFQVFFKQPDLIGVYWTLIIEMFFYISCSIIFYFNRLGSPWWIFFSLIFLSSLSCLFAYVRYTKGINLPIAVPLLLSIMFFGYMLKLKEKGIASTNILFFAISILMLSVLFSSYTGYTVK